MGGGLDAFDSWSVLRGAAALQLWPPNADRAQALAELDASLALPQAGTEGRPMAAADWEGWLSGSEGEAVRAVVPDGRWDSPLWADAELLGVRRRLFAGFLPSPEVHLRLWLQALHGALEDRTDEHLRLATHLLAIVAGLSDSIVREARLDEHWLADHSLEGRIGVPDEETFERLGDAVELTFSELGGDAFEPEVVEPLVATARTPSEDRWRTPLVISGERLMVASPRNLLLAGLVAAAQGGLASGSWDLVLDWLQRDALEPVRRIAADMDWSVEDQEGTSLLLRFDDDKLAAVDFLLAPVTPLGAPHVDAVGEVGRAHERLRERRAADERIELGLAVVLGDGRPFRCPLPEALDRPFGPWTVGLGELRLLGDAFRLRPLCLWRLLSRVSPPPWPGGADLLDVLGVMHRMQGRPAAPDDGMSDDGTEYLHECALGAAARHAAPRPDGEGWVTVSRWRGSADPQAFAAEEEIGRFAVLVRGPGRFCWVIADGDVDDEQSALSVLLRTVALWAARLMNAGWMVLPPPEDGEFEDIEVAARLVVSFDDRPGPALGLGCVPGTGRIVFGPAFLHALALGDNSADRMVVAALWAWWFDALRPDQIVALVDMVAPAGRGTVAIWADPRARRQPGHLAPPAPVPELERAQVGIDVAANVLPAGQLLAARDEQAPDALRHVNRFIVALIDHEVDQCAADILLELIRLHERMRRLQDGHTAAQPAFAAIPGADWLESALDFNGRDVVATRWLIERLAARPPQGSAVPSRARVERLRALGESLMEWGDAADAAHAGLAEVTVTIGPAIGCVVGVDGPVAVAREAIGTRLRAAAPRRAVELHPEWWAEDAAEPFDLELDRPWADSDPHTTAVNAEMERAWGYRLDELLRTVAALVDHATAAADGTAVANRAAVVETVRRATGLASERVEEILSALTIGPCDPYDPLSRPHKGWAGNRDRSYIRRPLVQLHGGRLGWSAAHTRNAGQHLIGLISSGRLRCEGDLERAVRRLSGGLDRGFEKEVEAECRALGLGALGRVTELDGHPLVSESGATIGDIDVLAFDCAARRVWLLDAKRLAPALTANDMRRQATRLSTYVGKHLKRLRWVEAHAELLDRALGGGASGDPWTSQAALVSDVPLAGDLLGPLDLPVWSIYELSDRLAR